MRANHDSVDRIEELLALCVERVETEGLEVVATICRDDPDLEEEVRRLLQLLHDLGLDTPDTSVDETSTAPRVGMLQEQFGPFRILELLGRGGMGTVYLAQDQDLGRMVALKVIRGDFLEEPKARSRFDRETAALARLNHPGLCTIYRAGEADGLPWISMCYVEGVTLEEILRERRTAKDGTVGDTPRAKVTTPSPESSGRVGSRIGSDRDRQGKSHLIWCLELFEKIARALQSAHEAGLVHRDLKPGNIMVRPDGDPVVLDFGLARDDKSDQALTMSGEQLGTPAYMSPEQVRGDRVDARSDQFGLAVTLFETLTGALPHEGATREEMIQSIVQGRRSARSSLFRGYPPELSIVIDKAMDPDPDQRYRTLAEFADDLRCLREHRTIHARKIGPPLRLRRWVQRNPVAASIVILLSAGIAASLILLHRGNVALVRSQARGYANLATSVMHTRPLHAIELALMAVDMEENPETLSRLEETLQQSGKSKIIVPTGWAENEPWEAIRILPSPEGEEDRYLILTVSPGMVPLDPILLTGERCFRLRTPYGGAYAGDWADDGEQFLTTARGPLIRIWSKEGRLLQEVQAPGPKESTRVAVARFFPDGRSFLASCSDGIVRRYDLEAKAWASQWPSKLCRSPMISGVEPISALDLDSEGRFCVVGSNRHGVEIIDLESGESRLLLPVKGVRPLAPAKSYTIKIEISPDRAHVLVHWAHGLVRLWTIEGCHLHTWGDDGNQTRACFSPDGSKLLTMHLEKHVHVWKLNSPDRPGIVPAGTLVGHEGWVTHGTFSRDGQKILTVGAEGFAITWSANSLLPIAKFTGHSSMIRAAAFDKSGSTCVLGGEVGRLRSHGFRRDDLPILEGHRTGVRAAFELPPGWPGRYVTRGADSRFLFHDVDGSVVDQLHDKGSGGTAVVLSPDGKHLVYTSWDGKVAMIERDGLQRREFKNEESFLHLAFVREDMVVSYQLPGRGMQILSLYRLDSTKGWIRCSKEEHKDFRSRYGRFNSMYFDARHRLLLVARSEGTVGIFQYEGQDAHLVRDLRVPGFLVNSMAVSRDGERILVGCNDTTARLISIQGELLKILPGHAGQVQQVDFSPDGRWILTGGPRSDVRIWDRQGRLQHTLKPSSGLLTHARFHSDSRRVYLSSTNGRTRFGWVDPKSIIEEARRREKIIPPQMWEEYHRQAGR